MRLASLALLGTLALAACGGGDGESRSEFVKRVDGVCKRGGKAPALSQARTRAAAESNLRKELAYREKAVARFAEATGAPPDEVRKDVDAYKRLNRKIISIERAQLAAVKRARRRTYVDLLPKLERAFKQRERAADRIGFKVCGQPA